MRYLSPLVFALLFASFLACKGENQNAEPVTAETKAEMPALTKSEIENAVVALNDAMVDPEKSRLEGMTSKILTYGHSIGNIQDRTEFIEELIKGPFDFLFIDTSDESIHISGNTAIARHVLSAKGTNKGEPADLHIGIMMVFQKRNGKLHLLARQGYKL